MRPRVGWPDVAGAALIIAIGVTVAGCGSTKKSTASGCLATHSAPTQPGSTSSRSTDPAAAPAWTLPGGNLQNTRDVTSPIDSSNVATLGVAWCVPVPSSAGVTDGYATTPVVVNGVVYTQDLKSNVMAIRLATGQVLWTHTYNAPNGGPDGVNVAGGVVYTATNHAAVATGKQLWSRTLISNNHEGIDMAPGYNDGTVYVSTVPVNPTVGQYLACGKGILWALNARTGTPRWSWEEVGNLWRNPGLNSAAACGIRRHSIAPAISTSALPTLVRSRRSGGPPATHGEPADLALTSVSALRKVGHFRSLKTGPPVVVSSVLDSLVVRRPGW